MTEPTGEHAGLSTLLDDLRHGRMIVGMPIGHPEQIADLRQRERSTAVGNVPRDAVIGRRLCARRIDGKCPWRRDILRTDPARGDREHADIRECDAPISNHCSPPCYTAPN